jgi:hypothetical protein
MNRIVFSLATLMLLACGPSQTSTQVSKPGQSSNSAHLAEPAPVEPTAAANDSSPAPTLPRVLLKAEDLLHNGNSLPVFLDANHVLHVGEMQASIDQLHPEAFFWNEQAQLSVVKLSAHEQAVLLATPTHDDEDPPNRYQLFLLRDEGLRRVYDKAIGVYGVSPLRVPGDGSLRFVEDGWTACERMKYPAKAIQQEVVLRLDANERAMVEQRRNNTSDSMVCDDLAACPYVYEIDDTGKTRLGEILRNIRGREASATQSLSLSSRNTGPLRLLVTEEKVEVTFLDALYVRAGGKTYWPTTCREANAPAYCRADGKAHVLRQGMTIDLEFAIPDGVEREAIIAEGYYLPTPTAHLEDRRFLPTRP